MTQLEKQALAALEEVFMEWLPECREWIMAGEKEWEIPFDENYVDLKVAVWGGHANYDSDGAGMTIVMREAHIHLLEVTLYNGEGETVEKSVEFIREVENIVNRVE